MNNIGISIKRFISNKNTVTILCVIAGIIILYVGYQMRIKSMTDPISVPYAMETLKSRTKITSTQVGEMNVPKAALKGKVYTETSDVIGKYVMSDTIIPAGSMFYERSVVEKAKLPGVDSLDYDSKDVLVNLSVTTQTTYGNLIYPDEYIDLYLKIMYASETAIVNNEGQEQLTVGKLLENVKVLKVVDSNGDNVFDDIENKKTPAQIIFAVPSEYHILIRKALYLRSYEATLIPVPTKVDSAEKPETTVSSTDLVDFINRVTYWSGQ